MKRTQKNKMAMNLSTREACERQMTIISAIPAFLEAYQTFIQRMDRILELFRIQDMKTTGITQTKSDSKTSMAKAADGIISGVRFYAIDTGNKALEDNVHYTLWEIMHARDFIALQRCIIIRNLAEESIASLDRYGISAADLNDFQIKIAAFKEIITKPQEIRTMKKVARIELMALFREIDHILKYKMDLMVKRLKDSHPQFYHEYFSARMIIDSGHGHSRKAESPETSA